MYHWVEDKEFLKRSYSLCADLVNQLVMNLKGYDIVSYANIVGSKSRNMVTQNEDGQIDFDFNLLVEDAEDYDAGWLKETVRKTFNEVLRRNELDDCDDSTSALTTKRIQFRKGNRTEFSIDICIVKRNWHGLHRLIHEKTGLVQYDRYYWNAVSNSSRLQEMEDALKPDYWQEVRETYLDKKNMYLQRPWDHSHPSFVCFVEAINEVYNKKRWQGLL